MPVVDAHNRLVGIVITTMPWMSRKRRQPKTFRKVGAVEALPVRLRHATVSLLYRTRVFWLVVLVFGNLVLGAAIAYFEETIAANLALGVLSAAAHREQRQCGRAVGHPDGARIGDGRGSVIKDWAGMLVRELAVSALLGVTMALAVSFIGVWRGGSRIALLVGLTMVLVVIAGSVIGMSLPFLLNRLRLDPAASSAPLITSIADGIGVIVYFTLASALLGR